MAGAIIPAMTLDWHGGAFEAYIGAEMARRLKVVGSALTGRIRRGISAAYPPASRPFMLPHLRSGKLKRSINRKVRIDSTAIILTVFHDLRIAFYGPWVETGTKRMKKRPHMHYMFNLYKPAILAYLTSGMNSWHRGQWFRETL